MSHPERVSIQTLLRRIIQYAIPLAVLVVIWQSLVRHYTLRPPPITDPEIVQARANPPDALLDELSRYYFAPTDLAGDPVESAERLLRGEVQIMGEESRRIRLPFDPGDISRGSIRWQLFQARLEVPRILMAGYRGTGREDMLVLARQVIQAWASHERRTIIPKGLLWNDHALAERVQVLAEFWFLYRHRPDFDIDVARDVFQLAAQSGRFLADDAHFTVASNHGIMQNLALWHLCLAFPTLPETAGYAALARERLETQLSFYLGSEGFILEHSSNYQAVGVQFIGTAFRYMSLLGIPVPVPWQQGYARAQRAYAVLRRPDGTLPVYGDSPERGASDGPPLTRLGPDGRFRPLETQKTWPTPPPASLYPVSGYSVWWGGNLARWPSPESINQTAVAWSKYPSGIHKHADEMSVLLWADGQSWWTNVGVWPGEWHGAEAISWNGSNAPHLTGESGSSDRSTRLLGQGIVEGLAFLDLERRGPDRFVARREVLRVADTIWAVIDYTRGAGSAGATTVWMVPPKVELRTGATASLYELRSSASTATLRGFVLGLPAPSVRSVNGSLAPFAGWMSPSEPTSAILIEQAAPEAVTASVWVIGRNPRPAGTEGLPVMDRWNGPEQWSITLPSATGPLRVVREGNTVSSEDDRGGRELALSVPAGIDMEIHTIQDAYSRAIARYPRFEDEVTYRYKATALVLVLFLLQEGFFAVYRRITRRWYSTLRYLAAGAWVLLGFWLVAVHVRLV